MLSFSTLKLLLPLPHYLFLSLRITTLSSPVISPHRQHQQQPPDELSNNPYDLMKEDPIQVCSDLWVRCFSRQDPHLPFPNLTGFLKKFDLWVLAYQRACAHHTGSFPPKNAIHLPHLRSLLALQRTALSPNYPWGASTHLLLRSPADPPPPPPALSPAGSSSPSSPPPLPPSRTASSRSSSSSFSSPSSSPASPPGPTPSAPAAAPTPSSAPSAPTLLATSGSSRPISPPFPITSARPSSSPAWRKASPTGKFWA